MAIPRTDNGAMVGVSFLLGRNPGDNILEDFLELRTFSWEKIQKKGEISSTNFFWRIFFLKENDLVDEISWLIPCENSHTVSRHI